MRNRYVSTVILLAVISAASERLPDAHASGTQQSVALAAAQNPAIPAPVKYSQTEKQKMLADQAKRLVDMATDLKTQVAKTNKNILSLAVVRKAEEIETLAHRMKEQAKPSVR